MNNNTALTLDKLSEIAGGPHFSTYGGFFMNREIDPAELKIDKHNSVSTYREDNSNRLIAMMDLKTGDLLG